MPIWSRGFSRTLDAAGGGRGFLRETLRTRIPPKVLDDVILMTSELTMNGVKHVPAAKGDRLEVLVEYGDGVLKISVRHPGTDFGSKEDIPKPGKSGVGDYTS